ncbi:hypothetical protein IQ264_17800 [Phormidium sp. LEGE 05292]|uniref:hypothetical protein n=1 Tax=[Phormidium] sp. LEGE 05292 TaxID=767427 RepID=UPI00187EA25B|nr:hypothetical protein [Phormidium sp. LEGE 05292]MBE9227283.1 hypothetical protein [Phormidium sp. LEGE 05292]
MSHLSVKSLAFYGSAIALVVLLFKAVTTYGTTMKAPPPIDGRYRITTQNLPGCLNSEKLLLTIQQSGVYLNGSLISVKTAEELAKTVEEKPSLTGKWNAQNQTQPLYLTGSLNEIKECQNQLVSIRGVVNGKTLKGQIKLETIPQIVGFTAEKENPEKSSKQLGH